jgi:hypothetical protein
VDSFRYNYRACMDMTTDDSAAQVPVPILVATALALSRAARWDEAFAILNVTAPTQAGRTALAIAAAQIAVECDYVTASHSAAERIEHARQLVAASPTPSEQWTVAYLHLRLAYWQALHKPDGAIHFGPGGRDLAELDALRDAAERLRGGAPSPVARGWAEMCLGWIADNLYGQRDLAPQHYSAGLQAGETGGDDLLVREALRHLGDHDHDRGDHAAALDRWQRATAVGARAGTVQGTLSQQILLAVLARDAGDEAGAHLLATEVARWADAIGAAGIHAQATAFLSGVDPTAPPPDAVQE